MRLSASVVGIAIIVLTAGRLASPVCADEVEKKTEEGTAAAAKNPVKAAAAEASHTKAAPAGKVAAPQANTAEPAASQHASETSPTAPPGGDVPAHAPDPSNPQVQAKSLEQQLKLELQNLRRFEAELEAVRSAPLPEQPELEMEQPVEKPKPKPVPLPEKPAPGLEEAFADCLYALGEHEKARAIYAEIAAGKPAPDTLAWAHFQIGNCARHLKDFAGAKGAYEHVLNKCQTSPWCKEAEWWAGQANWWLLYRKRMAQESRGAAPVSSAEE